MPRLFAIDPLLQDRPALRGAPLLGRVALVDEPLLQRLLTFVPLLQRSLTLCSTRLLNRLLLLDTSLQHRVALRETIFLSHLLLRNARLKHRVALKLLLLRDLLPLNRLLTQQGRIRSRRLRRRS